RFRNELAQADGTSIHNPRAQRHPFTTLGAMNMKRVTGIGGVFFNAKDPEKLKAWYRTHLGIESEGWGAVTHWRDDPRSDDRSTAWSVFAEETKHFEPSKKSFMINFRVENLDWLLP